MTQKIAYIFPSRSRPVKFFKTLNNIRKMSESDNYIVIAKLDEDDETMNTIPIRDKLEKDYPEVKVKWGLSGTKVKAINRDNQDAEECDILILQSDDIVWDVKGFDNIIRQAFNEHFPAFDGALHFPDDHGKSKTIIVSILGVNLYKRLGYIYHESFISVYGDDFFTEQVKKLRKHAYVDKRLFTHVHPMWGLAPWDAQYKATESKENYRVDRETFLRLRSQLLGYEGVEK